jgi:hypothetical protein
MSGKKILVTSLPPPRSPTILGENINVQFACSGKLSQFTFNGQNFFFWLTVNAVLPSSYDDRFSKPLQWQLHP